MKLSSIILIWPIIVSTFYFTAIHADGTCGEFFDCGNGRCIAKFFVCDDDNDCGNYKDELDCHDYKIMDSPSSSSSSSSQALNCNNGSFDCKDELHNCIPNRWICDGGQDCLNGADETNCTSDKVVCDGFLCVGSLECISSRWRCDSITDCSDGSDERNCTTYQDQEQLCNKEHGKYQCIGGHCIGYDKVCDGRTDCPQADDEGDQCHTKKCPGTNKCSHFCILDPNTKQPVCSCPPGYTLIQGKTCTDYDECADNKVTNICSQRCINLDGSYKCDCSDGYDLSGNTSCLAQGPSPLLYFSTRRDIHGYSLRDKIIFPVVSYRPDEIIVDLDMNIEQQKLYYTLNKKSSSSSVYELSLKPGTGSSLKRPKKLLFRDLDSDIEGITFDWLANHLYLSDNRNRIVVCHTGSMICATLLHNLHNPRGMLVLPAKGRLYWTQWGNRSGIFESYMDGTESSKLFGDISWPNDLSYDEHLNRLYFCDGYDGRIEYYDFDLETRTLVFANIQKHPFSLFVFEDMVYWTDWSNEELVGCDKFKCHHQKSLFRASPDAGRQVFGMTINHPVLQKSSDNVKNPCQQNPCSHLCLIKDGQTFTCFCPDHAYLSKDGVTCLDKDDAEHVLVSTGMNLYKFYPNSRLNSFEPVPIGSLFVGITDLTFNADRKEVFFYDQIKNHIAMISLLNPRKQPKTLVDYDLRGVFCLKYDINTNNVYWVDVAKGSLEVVNVNNSHRAMINHNQLDQPISMAISPVHKIIYVGLKTKQARIVALTMDGRYLRTVLKTTRMMIGLPMAITTHQNGRELIWADPILQKIDFINLKRPTTVSINGGNANGNGNGNGNRLVEKHVGTVQSIEILNRTLFWTNSDSPNLYWTTLDSGTKNVSWAVVPADSQIDGENLRVLSAQRQPMVHDYCMAGKNPCQQICLIGDDGPSCKCAVGFEPTNVQGECVPSINQTVKKPIIHFISLDKILDFILSKQEDKVSDSWTSDDGDDDGQDGQEGNKTSKPTELIEETKIIASNGSLLVEQPQEEAEPTDNGNFVKRNLYLLFFLLLSMFSMVVLFCVKLEIFRTRNIQSVMDFVRQRTRMDRSDQSKVRFFTNPNYNPNYNPAVRPDQPPPQELAVH